MLPSFIGICHVGGGGGCPAAGTLLRYDTVVYPVEEGGASVYVSDSGFVAQSFPSQNCDVAVRADGSCGEYQDFSTVTNIAYRSSGTLLTQSEEPFDISRPEVVINCTDVTGQLYNYPGYYYKLAYLDGAGSYYVADGSNNYYAYGTQASNSLTVNGPGCDGDNPIEVYVYWDGTGGWYYV